MHLLILELKKLLNVGIDMALGQVHQPSALCEEFGLWLQALHI